MARPKKVNSYTAMSVEELSNEIKKLVDQLTQIIEALNKADEARQQAMSALAGLGIGREVFSTPRPYAPTPAPQVGRYSSSTDPTFAVAPTQASTSVVSPRTPSSATAEELGLFDAGDMVVMPLDPTVQVSNVGDSQSLGDYAPLAESAVAVTPNPVIGSGEVPNLIPDAAELTRQIQEQIAYINTI